MSRFRLAQAYPPPETTFAYAVQGCACGTCLRLSTRHPGEGYQLRLRVVSSGGRPEAAPLTDPDAPAALTAGVSAPRAAQSKHALAAATQPETDHE